MSDDKRKNIPDDPLDDLLRSFEEEEIMLFETEKKDEKFNPDLIRSEVERKNRVEQFSLNIDGEEIPKYNGEVYFSDPPQSNRKEAVGGKISNQSATKNKSDSVKEKKQFKFKNFNFKHNWIIPTASSLVLTIATIVVLSVFLIAYMITAINDIFGISRDGEYVDVEIDGQDTRSKVIDVLDDEGLITNSSFCKLFAFVFNISDEGYTSGVYSLSADMGLEKMLAKIRLPSTSTETITLTFPEGWTVDQIADKLELYEVCSKTALLQTIDKTDFSDEYVFLKGIDNRDKRYRVLEGFLFPDTYEFYIGESPSSVVKRFLNNFDSKWTEDFQKRADKLEYTADQVITLASIIEREAYSKQQMAPISSVLHNRLDNPGVYPTLQCDSSTSYLQTYVKPNCTSSEYINYVQNYDTYLCYRFPAGAIANPGLSAIKAALYPEDTDYNFFQHDKNGTIYYAVTASQHRTNTEKVWKVNNS